MKLSRCYYFCIVFCKFFFVSLMMNIKFCCKYFVIVVVFFDLLVFKWVNFRFNSFRVYSDVKVMNVFGMSECVLIVVLLNFCNLNIFSYFVGICFVLIVVYDVWKMICTNKNFSATNVVNVIVFVDCNIVFVIGCVDVYSVR